MMTADAVVRIASQALVLALLGTACSSESVVTLAPVEPNATRSTPAATAETTMTTTEAPTS